MELYIQKFDISNIKNYSNILIIGKRGTGKTTLIKNLLTTYHDETKTIVSCTEESDSFYTNLLRDSAQISSSTDIIDSCVQTTQQTYKSEQKSLLIVDGCNYYKRSFIDSKLKPIFFNRRHYNISLIMTLQYSMISPQLRANTDYIFIFNDKHVCDRKRLFDQYAKHIIGSYQVFSAIMDSLQAFECIVIDNTPHFSETFGAIEKHIFYYNFPKKFDNHHLSAKL